MDPLWIWKPSGLLNLEATVTTRWVPIRVELAPTVW